VSKVLKLGWKDTSSIHAFFGHYQKPSIGGEPHFKRGELKKDAQVDVKGRRPFGDQTQCRSFVHDGCSTTELMMTELMLTSH